MPKREEAPVRYRTAIKKSKKSAFEPEPATNEFDLPDEIVWIVMGYLTERERSRAALVCRQFMRAALDDFHYRDDYVEATGGGDELMYERFGSYRRVVFVLRKKLCCLCGFRKGLPYALDDRDYCRVCDACRGTDPDYVLVTKTKAKSEYLLNDKDLESIGRSLERPNPYYKRAPPMVLYRLRDAIALAHAKHGGPEGLANAKIKSERRKAKLEANREAKRAAEGESEQGRKQLANILLYKRWNKLMP